MKEAIPIRSCSSSRIRGEGVKLEASWSKKLAFGLRSDKFRPISDATHASGTRTENRDSEKSRKLVFFFSFSLFFPLSAFLSLSTYPSQSLVVV